MQSSPRMFEVILHKVVQSGPFLALDTFYWLTTTVHHIKHDFGFIHACVPQPELFGAPLVNQLPFFINDLRFTFAFHRLHIQLPMLGKRLRRHGV